MASDLYFQVSVLVARKRYMSTAVKKTSPRHFGLIALVAISHILYNLLIT